MKKLRFSFAALVTLVAIGLTLAANAGAFKNTNFDPSDGDCYTALPLYDASANCAQILVDPTDPCGDIAVGDALRLVPTGSIIPASEIEESCPGAPNFFCCAQLEVANPVICNQPTLTIGQETAKFRVAFVKCKQIQG